MIVVGFVRVEVDLAEESEGGRRKLVRNGLREQLGDIDLLLLMMLEFANHFEDVGKVI